MGFSDVNVIGLRDEGLDDPLQRIVDEHTREDDDHWPMFLEDISTLGLNTNTSLADCLETHWDTQHRRTRELTYALMHLARGSEPALRVALVEAIEATGFVAWRAFLSAAEAYTAQTGRTLRYFGPEHAALETGHAMGSDTSDHTLQDIELDAGQQETAKTMVDEVFQHFAAMFDEQLEFARSR